MQNNSVSQNNSAEVSLSVSRNGKTLVFSPTEFKRDPNKSLGIKFPSLEVTKETIQDYISWHGEEDFYPFFNAQLSKLFQSVWKAAIDDKGIWSESDNRTMLEKLSTRGESKSVIEAKVADLIKELNNPDLMQAILMGEGDAKVVALQSFTRISAELKKFSDALENKKRVKNDDNEEEETTQAAAHA
jgi:hypothetical protein